MPYCYFPLERLGVVDQLMESACPRKYCVQFVRQDSSLSQPFYFSSIWTTLPQLRGRLFVQFDKILLDNARDKGAKVMEQTRGESSLGTISAKSRASKPKMRMAISI